MTLRFLVFLAAVLYGISFASPVQDSTQAQAKDSTATIKTSQPQRYLHVATNPTMSDIYVNKLHTDFSSKPNYVSPGFIKVPQGDTTVRVTLFQAGYRDTTINISLSEKDTSYLIVALRQSYDTELIDAQNKLLAQRKRKLLGHKLIWASLVPFAASAVSAIVTHKYIQDAKDDRKAIENSRIRKGDSYQDKKDSFADNRDKAKRAKVIGGTTLGVGIVVLSAGLILSF